MICEVVASCEPFSAMRTFIIPSSIVLLDVPLPVGLDRELESTLVADERLDASVGAHVLLEQGGAKIGLFTECTFERPGPLILVLPHVVIQVTLGHKLLFTNITLVRLLSLMLYPNMFID